MTGEAVGNSGARTEFVITGATIVPMDGRRSGFTGWLSVKDGRIAGLGAGEWRGGAEDEDTILVDRRGFLLLPGFVQAHVHLCQSLFRGLADNLRLDRWLQERIWPLEAAHTPESLAASAAIGIAEGLLAGTTTFVDMGTVHHTESICATAEAMGVRAILSKALMDRGENVPPRLLQGSEGALSEALAIHSTWSGRGRGRISVALAPRFTLSVSEGLWRELGQEASSRSILVHTHASETPWENEECQRIHGGRPLALLERWGVLEAKCMVAHAIWIEESDIETMRRREVGVVHCPGSNTKLGSGMMDLARLSGEGIAVGLGSDGAACDDTLSIPAEMRTAAQLVALKSGPESVDALSILEAATLGGARAAGLADSIGSLEPGKQADFVLFRMEDLGWDVSDWHSAVRNLVHSGVSARPWEVCVGGHMLVEEGRLANWEWPKLAEDARIQRARLLERADLRR